MPDTLVNPESGDPQTIAVHRESLRLALIASLQYLPPRQRAVLLLRDVLAFPAGEVATILGTTTVAVKSALQRARARLDEVAPTPELVTEPSEPAVRAQLEQYIAAFVKADAAGLQRLLLADTTLELLPSPIWYAGSEAAARATAGLGSPGDWRMIPTTANGQPAVAAYLRGPDGVHRAFGIVVLTTAAAGLARITVFAEPALLVAFGLPPFHPPHRAQPAHPAHLAAADRPGGPNTRLPEEKTTMTTENTPRTDEADDAIRTLFGEVSRAWADGDADTFAQWYADDATVILPGYHLPGRKAIREAMGAAFAGPLHGTRRIHEVLSIRYLDAETALVITRSATVPSAGTEVPEHLRERATWALSRRHGHWLVEAYHSCPESVLGTS